MIHIREASGRTSCSSAMEATCRENIVKVPTAVDTIPEPALSRRNGQQLPGVSFDGPGHSLSFSFTNSCEAIAGTSDLRGAILQWREGQRMAISTTEAVRAVSGLCNPKHTGLVPAVRVPDSSTYGRGAVDACPGSSELKVHGLSVLGYKLPGRQGSGTMRGRTAHFLFRSRNGPR